MDYAGAGVHPPPPTPLAKPAGPICILCANVWCVCVCVCNLNLPPFPPSGGLCQNRGSTAAINIYIYIYIYIYLYIYIYIYIYIYVCVYSVYMCTVCVRACLYVCNLNQPSFPSSGGLRQRRDSPATTEAAVCV